MKNERNGVLSRPISLEPQFDTGTEWEKKLWIRTVPTGAVQPRATLATPRWVVAVGITLAIVAGVALALLTR